MDFPSGPVAKTLCSQGRGLWFDPWSGNQIPQATAMSSQTAAKDPTGLNEDLPQPNQRFLKVK